MESKDLLVFGLRSLFRAVRAEVLRLRGTNIPIAQNDSRTLGGKEHAAFVLPIVTLRAIILRRRDSGESDRSLTALTEERGLVDVIAKGARKSGSRLSGCSEPLSVCEMEVAKGKAREFVTQAQPIMTFPKLRDDYDRLAAGLAFAEIVVKTTPHERPEPELFTLVLIALKHLELHEKPLVALAWAQVKLLEVIGNLPSFDGCVETGKKIQEAEPFFSPSAGGYLVHELGFQLADKVKTKAEVLVGLAKLSNLEEPPGNLKFVEESLRLLHCIWLEIAGKNLTANDQLLKSLHLGNGTARTA